MAFEKAVARRSQVQVEVAGFTIGRAIRMHGVEVGGSMALTTWTAFSGSEELAGLRGDPTGLSG